MSHVLRRCNNKHKLVFITESELELLTFAAAEFKPTRIFTDIEKRNVKDLPDHDVYVAGPPCQAWSTSGLRGGLSDARGRKIFRVCEVAQEKQPAVIVLENVLNLMKDFEDVFKQVCRRLRGAAYQLKFDVVDTAEMGFHNGGGGCM